MNLNFSGADAKPMTPGGNLGPSQARSNSGFDSPDRSQHSPKPHVAYRGLGKPVLVPLGRLAAPDLCSCRVHDDFVTSFPKPVAFARPASRGSRKFFPVLTPLAASFQSSRGGNAHRFCLALMPAAVGTIPSIERSKRATSQSGPRETLRRRVLGALFRSGESDPIVRAGCRAADPYPWTTRSQALAGQRPPVRHLAGDQRAAA